MSTRINDVLMQDFTTAVNTIERPWNLLDSMNIATVNRLSTETATVDVIKESTDTVGDKRRGSDRSRVKSEVVLTKPLQIPFFPLDGEVRPTDLQNLRKWGTENELQSTDETVMKIMTRLRRYQSALKEKAMAVALQGASYAPNGNYEVYNYYTVMEQTQKAIDFDFANITKPMAKVEEAFGHIVDNANDGATGYEVVAICGPVWFQKLVDHAAIETAYAQYVNGPQEPLRNRLGGNSIYRTFEYGNVLFVEYRGAFGGTALVPAGEAYFFPMGVDGMLEIDYAPADTLDHVNTPGQDLYMFVERSRRKVTVESESAILVANTRPELVVKATSSS